MALAHANFASPELQTMRGYNLKNFFDMLAVAHFWTTKQNHIYKTLNYYLEPETRVEKKFIEPEDKSNHKEYSISKTRRPNRAAG